MKKKTFIICITRILIGMLWASILITDLIGIAQDPTTYEQVYTGEFMGENRFETLHQYKTSIVLQTIFIASYMALALLHCFILRDKRIISWCLVVMDIILLVLILYPIVSVN